MISLGLLAVVLLQSTLFSIPFMIPILFLYLIYTKNPNTFLIAVLFGALIDALLLNPIGQTSIFLCVFLFISSLYRRIFEIETFYFAAIFTLVGSAIYSYIFYPQAFILKAIVCFLITFVIYYSRKFIKNKSHKRIGLV
jgi:cell shape-determining protein MreD